MTDGGSTSMFQVKIVQILVNESPLLLWKLLNAGGHSVIKKGETFTNLSAKATRLKIPFQLGLGLEKQQNMAAFLPFELDIFH